MSRLKLHSYFRSSASYRVRIALYWKELDFDYIPVHLLREGGQQHKAEYRKINPLGHVPTLDHEGFLVSESVAIVQYLDEVFPQKSLFPKNPQQKAKIMQVVELLNSGIQPLQNLKILGYMENQWKLSADQRTEWCRHWIDGGLSALEKILEKTAGTFCFGGEVSAADAFLIPQCFASRRFNVRIESYPTIARIEQAAIRLPAFQKAHPEAQPDFAP